MPSDFPYQILLLQEETCGFALGPDAAGGRFALLECEKLQGKLRKAAIVACSSVPGGLPSLRLPPDEVENIASPATLASITAVRSAAAFQDPPDGLAAGANLRPRLLPDSCCCCLQSPHLDRQEGCSAVLQLESPASVCSCLFANHLVLR